MSGLRRYEFSERLAQILGGSRRDVRFRVTLMVTDGLIKAGPRGRGAPPATPDYAANLLIGVMAAPQQANTVEAIRCYRALEPVEVATGSTAPRVIFGPAASAAVHRPQSPALPLLSEGLGFGEELARLLSLAGAERTRHTLAEDLFGVWISRGFPVAAVQLGTWLQGRRTIVTKRYELAPGARPPAWLDPDRGGVADPGLLHTVFLPASKLIEIGGLTSIPDERGSPMINLGPKMAKIAKLADLARKARDRRPWEKVLTALASVQAWTDKVDAKESRLLEVSGFGTNPGELRMFTYVPPNLPPSAPLVVILHGCTQTAHSYDEGTGWSTLADRFGFALLFPQQQWTNNPLRCFNWFRPEDTTRGNGESLSIKQMVDRMRADYAIDGRRVYVTGVSSGAAMTSAMLATYPDVFAGGAILAGVPYGTATGLQDAFESMFQGRNLQPQEWGDRVRAASPHAGPWPKVSVWHGDADFAVKPANADEIVKQWTNVHGLDLAPTVQKTVDGYPHRVWQNGGGEDLVEAFTITGMSHGAALDVGHAPHQCGTAAPFFNDVGISSTYHIASFWGLPEWSEAVAAEVRPSASATEGPAFVSAPEQEPGEAAYARASEAQASGPAADSEPASKSDAEGDTSEGDVISRSLEATRRLKGAANGLGGAAGFGFNVHGIVSKSLEAAGLIKDGGRSRKAGNAPLGIDVPGIVATSLEAAGLFKDRQKETRAANGGDETLASSEWQGEGWELLADEDHAYRRGPSLFGQVSSGKGCDTGHKTRSVSRQLSLGPRPELSYVRKLDLNAAANDYTRASFSVLVDGIQVDEVTAVGMDHKEANWMRRTGIDLTPFADRTVTLTLEVTANSNVCNEVLAKAWVDEVAVQEATAAGSV